MKINSTGAPLIPPETFEAAADNLSSDVQHQIHTRRLYLRPVSTADLDHYVALLSDPLVMRFVGINTGEIPGGEEITRLFQAAITVWQTRGYGRWSLFSGETGEFVGFCGFRSEKGQPELICIIKHAFWNQGLATEAAAACLRYAFENLGFTRVRAFTLPNNIAARRVLEKLNANFDGLTDFHGITGAAYSFSAPPPVL